MKGRKGGAGLKGREVRAELKVGDKRENVYTASTDVRVQEAVIAMKK